MKLGISGSRYFNDYKVFSKHLDEFRKNNDVEMIIEGDCSGVDTMAKRYAKENNIELRTFPPEFHKYKGNRAYYERIM